ncbi:MAG: 16S rRNA (guanine(527)-N(7))-methyltransferase RsmG [Solirubrobacterales bacterium]
MTFSARLLDASAVAAMTDVVELLEPRRAPTSVRDPARAWDVHVADSLSAVEAGLLEPGPARIADIGAGAGFPGLALAAAVPAAHVDLVESIARKCAFCEEAIRAASLSNCAVLCARAEEFGAGAGREAYDVVTARAVGPLAVLAELASPLLQAGGTLIAWKGTRDAEDETRAVRAADRLAMAPEAIVPVTPFEGSRNRHLHVLRKTGPTPADLPRRPGMAAKRPFGRE